MAFVSSRIRAHSPARLSVRAGLIASAGWALALAAGMQTGRVYPALGMYGAFIAVVYGVPFYRRCPELFRPRLLDGLLGGGVGFLAVGATHVAWPFIVTRLPGSLLHVRELYDVAAITALTFPLLLLVPVIEEVLWRGFLLESLLEQQRPLAAVGLSAAAYAIAQGGAGSWLLVGAAAGLGLLTAGLRLMTGGLLAPTVAHVIWTGCILSIFPLVSP